ncbi:MAG: 4'-phosphopantetheinyl transferase family protein [Acidimicrobiales bacterium]
MPWPDLAPVAGRLAAELGVDLRLAQATDPLDEDDLSDGERRRAARIPNQWRRDDFRRGRRALRHHGVADSSSLTFPHARLSLSHAAGLAVAVWCDGVSGVGVDIEPYRDIDLRAARFFLRPDEPQPTDGRELVRLWAVKEALFKATPANAGLTLLDIALDDPARRWAAANAGPGVLAIAITPEEVVAHARAGAAVR